MIQGTLEKIEKSEGVGKTGRPYERFVFHVDGKQYSSFDNSLAAKVKVGDFVEIMGEQNGKFFNMKDIRKSDIPQDIVVQKMNPTRSGTPENNQRRICRMNCVSNAIKFHEKVDDCKIEDVLELAQIFYRYVWDGNDGNGQDEEN